MDRTNTIEPLSRRGLTGLAAELYVLLLQDSPATGYRLAKELGKPVANVYKALETLEGKGAIEADRGKTRIFRPLPAEDFLGILESRFRHFRDKAAEGLRDLPGPKEDSRIYHLSDRDQVFRKCHQLLERAECAVILDMLCDPLDEWLPQIECTAARGIDVVALVYAPIKIPGVETVLDPDHERTRRRWPAQWISMAVDGSQMLAALLNSDGSRVIQAVWSKSPFLSWIHSSGLANELCIAALRRDELTGAPSRLDPATASLFKRFVVSVAPGYSRLRSQLGVSDLQGAEE